MFNRIVLWWFKPCELFIAWILSIFLSSYVKQSLVTALSLFLLLHSNYQSGLRIFQSAHSNVGRCDMCSFPVSGVELRPITMKLVVWCPKIRCPEGVSALCRLELRSASWLWYSGFVCVVRFVSKWKSISEEQCGDTYTATGLLFCSFCSSTRNSVVQPCMQRQRSCHLEFHLTAARILKLQGVLLPATSRHVFRGNTVCKGLGQWRSTFP
jgi:hypothetical protein